MNALPTTGGILTITQVAKLAGKPKHTLYRNLLALHARDREQGAPGDWLLRCGSHWRVNMARLEKCHPALFHTKYVTGVEFDELAERVTELEARTSEMRSETRIRIGAVAARVRELSGKVAG